MLQEFAIRVQNCEIYLKKITRFKKEFATGYYSNKIK